MKTNNKKMILLVDDEPDICLVIGSRLTNAGYRVLTAFDGHNALKILEREIPDLVLLDVSMPGMDGFEVCSRIRRNKFMSNVPIIFFTARQSVEDKIRGLKQDVHDYITKPVDHRELLARIKAALKITERYYEDSIKDELTGLFNYNYFEKNYTHMFDMARRYNRVFSLLVIDINDFKKMNDTHGHLCGNFILQKVARRLNDSIRKVDILTRYGGDEFAIILPETNERRARNVLKKLRVAAGEFTASYKGKAISVCLSFGLATYTNSIKSKEALFTMADKNMYKDKKKKEA